MSRELSPIDPVSTKDWPPEALEKLIKFRSSYKLFFKKQIHAAEALEIEQGVLSRILCGKIAVSSNLAIRFQFYTKNKVSSEDIYFDFMAWRKRERKAEKCETNLKKSA